MFVSSRLITSKLRMMLCLVGLCLVLPACGLSVPGASVLQSDTSVKITIAPTKATVPTNSLLAQQPVQPTQPTVRVVQAAPAVTQCQLKTNWMSYTAQPNDTLSAIAARTGTDTQTLAQANCLTDMNMISVGQNLYVPSLPVTANPPSLAVDACVARTSAQAALYSWHVGTDAYVVAQPPADLVMPVNQIGFNGYVSLTYNGTTGWADLSSVLLSGECAGLIPAEFTRCLVWAARESYEFNLMIVPEGEPIVMFPARVWVYATAYRPSRVGESAYFGGKGWYKVLLM